MDRAGAQTEGDDDMVRVVGFAWISFLVAVGILTPANAAFPGVNGRLAYFISNGPVPGRQVFTIEPDGTGKTQLTASTHARIDPSWSADGAWIVYVARSERTSRLRIMPADGSVSTLVGAGPFEGYRKFRSPVFSPDGTKIAFCGRDPVDPTQPFARVLVINSDGSGLTRISNWTHPNCFLSWSPDGTRIAAGTYGGRGAAIVTMEADGGGRQIVVSGGGNYTPDWSPDGTHLVFLRYEWGTFDYSDVYTVLADGRSLTNVTNSPDDSELLPTYSPDGTSIAFSRMVGGYGGQWDLWTANVDGSSPFQVTYTAKSEFGVDWQPTST